MKSQEGSLGKEEVLSIPTTFAKCISYNLSKENNVLYRISKRQSINRIFKHLRRENLEREKERDRREAREREREKPEKALAFSGFDAHGAAAAE